MERFAEDFDFIIQPGWKGSGADHWQRHWQQRLHAIAVENDNWDQPDLESWLQGLDKAVAQARRPVIVIAHSLGCITLAHYAQRWPGKVAGAFLVAPADVERPFVPRELLPFAPLPRHPLPFPSRVIASDDDPFCKSERAARLAGYWQSPLSWLHQAGHINVASGHRQWEDGLALLQPLLETIRDRQRQAA